MSTIWLAIKVICVIIAATASVSFWINGFTGWGDHGKDTKLLMVAVAIIISLLFFWFIIFIVFDMPLRPKFHW